MHRALVLLFVASGLCACDAVTSPVVPVSPAPAPPPPVLTGGAELKVSDVALLRSNKLAELTQYWVVFALTEISGKSGALITSVRVAAGERISETGSRCWADDVGAVRVAAGDTSRAFNWGGDVLLDYCSPLLAYPGFPPSLSVTVQFIDDGGEPGEVTTRFDLTPASCPNCAV